MTPYLLILAVLLGIAPGLIAHGKGRNFVLWWIYGVVLGPVALLHAILLRRRPEPFYATSYHRPRTRWRSNWPVALWGAASLAIAIIAVAGYELLAPPPSRAPSPDREIAISADRTPPGQASASRRAAEQGAIARVPAADQPARRDPPPHVRVTVRHETPTSREEQTARAPSMPVERVPAERHAAALPNERTKPQTPSAPPADIVAARTAPAPSTVPAPPPPAAPPAVPPVATATPQMAEPAPAVKPAPPPAPTDVTAVGETVRIVQLALAERGYNPGAANGRAGRQTQAAIQKFQADRGLPPTGAIDYDLLEKLGIVGPRVHAFRPPPPAPPGR